MTRSQQAFKALSPVRGALRGWAFAQDPHGYVRHAKTVRDTLPAQYQPTADEMIGEVERILANK